MRRSARRSRSRGMYRCCCRFSLKGRGKGLRFQPLFFSLHGISAFSLLTPTVCRRLEASRVVLNFAEQLESRQKTASPFPPSCHLALLLFLSLYSPAHLHPVLALWFCSTGKPVRCSRLGRNALVRNSLRVLLSLTLAILARTLVLLLLLTNARRPPACPSPLGIAPPFGIASCTPLSPRSFTFSSSFLPSSCSSCCGSLLRRCRSSSRTRWCVTLPSRPSTRSADPLLSSHQ